MRFLIFYLVFYILNIKILNYKVPSIYNRNNRNIKNNGYRRYYTNNKIQYTYNKIRTINKELKSYFTLIFFINYSIVHFY